MGSKQNILQVSQAKIRLLLALWDLGGTKQEIKKSQLTKRIVSKGKKVADYQDILDELQQQGAIAVSKTGYSLTSDKGVELLAENLRSGNFRFEGTIVGTWAANALVRWISQIDVAVTKQAAPVNGVKNAIASYEEFKSELLDLFDQLNTTNSYGGLVPIWHLRHVIGNRVIPENFNNWIMNMQSEQLFYLQSGQARGATEEQKRNSINSEIRGLLFFASKSL